MSAIKAMLSQYLSPALCGIKPRIQLIIELRHDSKRPEFAAGMTQLVEIVWCWIETGGLRLNYESAYARKPVNPLQNEVLGVKPTKKINRNYYGRKIFAYKSVLVQPLNRQFDSVDILNGVVEKFLRSTTTYCLVSGGSMACQLGWE